MPRLPYAEHGTSSEVDSLYAEITRMGRPVANLYKMLANQPPALAAFLDMSRYVRSSSSLDPGLRELVILATAHEFGQEYELAHHREVAQNEGVSPAKIASLGAGGDLSVLTNAERCAVDFARQVAHTRDCDAATFQSVRRLFPNESVIDLVLTAAWYHLCAVILDSTHVDLEPEYRAKE